MATTPLRVIQISDTHLYADANKAILGVKSYESFHAVLDLLRRESEQCDLILHSGDLSQDGWPV
jgi:3',5'-cyclic-AMP phosphodiesterase